MNARTRAMMAHPAGKALMSADEMQARQDDEACQVASANWRPAPDVPRRRWLEVLALTLTTIAVVALPLIDVFILNTPAVAA